MRLERLGRGSGASTDPAGGGDDRFAAPGGQDEGFGLKLLHADRWSMGKVVAVGQDGDHLVVCEWERFELRRG
ncbi:MAG TPA: hypothetical protein VFA45_22315, partial [Actinomycetes bacterium]|nr:hypothetical protein [Actinomycetes bacterium]